MIASQIVKNSFYAILVQVITLGVGVLKSFILPLLLGVIGFGYWQMYLLYVGFVGLFALGFNDGLYLKYGGCDYEELPQKLFKTSLVIFFVAELIISIFLCVLLPYLFEGEKLEILFYVTINISLMGLIGSCVYIYQVTNRIKEYSFYSLIDKFIFIVSVLFLFFIGSDNYRLIIYLDIISKLIVLLLMILSFRDIFFSVGCAFKEGYKEFKNNIVVGVKLMFALFSASLLMGLAKIFVENYRDIEEFSVFSFACSSTNILLFFVSGLALVIYPALKRMNRDKYSAYFTQLNSLVCLIFAGGLLVYYPLCAFIGEYMSDYSGIFKYFPLIIVLVFLQSKTQIIINTFYKCLRAEKIMLWINIVNIFLFCLFLCVFYFFYQSIFSVVMAIIVSSAIILYISEIYLRNKLKIANSKSIIGEIGLMVIFVLTAYLNSWIGIMAYILSYTVYVICNYRDIISILLILKKYSK